MLEIKDFLPQKPPFLFLDKLISADTKFIIGQKTYGADFTFYQKYNDKQIVPSMILLESLMQCGGAATYIYHIDKSHLYVVGAIKKVTMSDTSVHFNDTVIMKVKTLHIRQNYFSQEGTAYLHKKSILTACWQWMAIPSKNK